MRSFIESLKRQQLKSPLDVVSRNVVNENLPVVDGWTSAGDASSNGYFTVKVNGISKRIMTRA